MSLDDNAKISDIITSLSDMQGINQKAELASVIGSPATNDDNIATQITKLQDAKDVFADKIGVENTMPLQQMADSLVVGKKWASGTLNIPRYGGDIVVTGIGFKPSFIILSRSPEGYPSWGGWYVENINSSKWYYASESYDVVQMTNGSFTLYNPARSISDSHWQWYAFE